MPPVDSQLPIPAGPQGGAGTMSLSTLIEFIIQRTYHELTVLSELLPRKTDMERKIEIVQFASRTRQMFIRLLALVKWANSASKVDKCAEICYFLEKQSMLFVETADMLARMARETLLNARLPNFSLPCAVDVLTTGTYPRLPACIRDKIVPPDPITIPDKRMTLQRLNQVIQYRLVSSDLPQQMRRLRIENGRVKFLVEYEFEVTLTLMGDSSAIPWRLLDIDILVEDHETGSGKNLVHSLQVNFIHQLIQSRLLDNDKPLHDLYKVLHSFCQSLQLEVLHSQTQRLIRDQLGDSIRVEDYSTVGKCLVISYWREQLRKEPKPNELPTIFKLTVHVSEENPSKPLQITHIPAISAEDSKKVGLAIRSDQLSIEKLLVQTVEIRTLAKLKDLGKDLQKFVEGKCEIKDMPPSLQVSVISPCLSCEILRLAVDIQRGTLLASVSSTDHPVIQEIEDALNGERRGVDKLILTLRLHLALLRCEKSVQHIPAVCQKKLPLINLMGHPVESLSKQTLFVRLPRHTNFYLVVELPESLSRSVEFRYYLLQVTPTTYDGVELDLADDSSPKTFMRANRLLPLNTFSVTHGPHTKLYDMEAHEMDSITRKRKLLLGDSNEPSSKKTKGSSYFVPELCYLLACCDERIPIVFLGAELEKHGIAHGGLEIDGEGTAMCLTLLELPEVRDVPASMCKQLRKDLLSCKFRIQGKPYKNWLVEFLFYNNPLKSSNTREQGSVQRTYFMYELGTTETMEKVLADFLGDWGALTQLYTAVQNFAKVYNDARSSLQSCVDVRSYDYKRLVLLYGPTRNHVVTISWKSELFHVSLGTTGSSVTANCHLPVLTQLQESLNSTKSIIHLTQILTDSWSPLSSIAKLSTMPIYNGPSHKQAFLSFTIIPQTPNHIRIAFRNSYVLDVHCKSGKLVSVRDGAYSLFDSSKCVDSFSPTPGLKAFLNMFVDEAVLASYARRRSTTEDDNPPSPVGMDSLDTMFLSQPSAGSPSSRRQDLRFQSPLTPPSNPHTPASPSTSRVSAGGYPSPAAAFPLSSPPSLPSQVGASPAALMGTPSPGTLLGANSPGNPHLHVPSPSSFVPAPSPQSLGIHMPSPATSFISPQSMVEGGNSPYPSSNLAMPSPGTRNWPNSPSVGGPSPASRHGMAHSPGHAALHSPQMHMKDADHMRSSVVSPPSRMLPPRSWAASIPTLLSHEAFSKLLTPGTLPNMTFLPCSPLERFMGCVYLRRQLHRVVQSDEVKLNYIQCNEPGVTMFKAEALQLRVSLNPNTLQTLHLKATPTPTPTANPDVQFTAEDTQVLERFFDVKDTQMLERFFEVKVILHRLHSFIQPRSEDTQMLERFFDVKVACPPYNCSALRAIGRLLSAPTRILKDCIQIMKLELVPQPNLKWSVQWCLTLPPGAGNVAPAGTPAIVIKNTKMFLMLQLTRIGLTLPPGTEPHSVVVPLLYDQQTNNINILDRQAPNTPANTAIMSMLKRFAEFHQKPNECAIFPAVRELMSNFVIPVSS